MRPIVLTTLALLLAGCASDGAKPPICDGRQLRPANPYGSTLSPPLGQPSPTAGPKLSAPVSPAASKPATMPKGCGG